MKPNCYACVHRGTVPGSVHSSCQHPATARVHETAVAKFVAVVGKRSGLTSLPLDTAAASLHVETVALGREHGWALWPANFDPIWIERCDGFTPKEQAATA